MPEIYELLDGDGTVRYVGKTSHTGAQRLRGHVSSAKAGSALPIHRWLRKHDFICVLRATPTPLSNLNDAERAFIARERQAGNFKLLNCTDGGDGQSPGYVPPPQQRRAVAAANRVRIVTDEQRARSSEVHKGKVLSPETRAKISASAKGVKRPGVAEANRRRKISS